MIFTGSTRAGDARQDNQDWLSATSDVFVVLDGATIRTDTGCEHDPAWYTRKLGGALISNAVHRSRSLVEILADSIQDVSDRHRDTCDLTHPGTPSAAVGIVRVEGDVVRYAVLGDVTIAVETTDSTLVITDDRVSRTAQEARAEADRHLIGTEAKAKALLAMKEGELAARNQPDGYWIASAEPRAAEHAYVGELSAETVRRLIVATDGVGRIVDLFKQYDWNDVLNLAKLGELELLLDQIRQLEQLDPLGKRYPRNKVSDDATVLHAAPQLNVEPTTALTDDEKRRAKQASDAVLDRLNAPGVLGAEPARAR